MCISFYDQPSSDWGFFTTDVNVLYGGYSVSNKWDRLSSLDTKRHFSTLAGLINLIFGRAVIARFNDGKTSQYQIVTRESLNTYIQGAKQNLKFNNQKAQDFKAGYFFQTIVISQEKIQ